ncbi:piggyBac transposable element-derived protein 4-like isoform X2 [Polistes fuscatus]|uniref:piggyBac transposable element-derived protein 4-like isoform X2 n=1 Tax=Polistes fuscatus TaxID=30207 RepID=UPI001CA7BCF2|nr:piggyBac transposable element-derived protein 4-like isoform X2 [Polistes fuscatus]
MFVRQHESVSVNDSSSDEEEMFKFPRKLSNIIASNSSSENEFFNETEDFEELLENLTIEEENEQTDNIDPFDNIQWMEFTGKQKLFEFTGKSGLLVKLPPSITAGQVLSLFLNEQVINLIVMETNRYAEKKFFHNANSEYAQENGWKPTNSEEIKIFLGLLLWIDLVQVPLTKCCEAIQPNNRLGKVLLLLQILTDNYQQIFLPGPEIVVDETLVPWRGRLIYRQYIPIKSHKYGIRLFKLCSAEGYTWSIKIYAGGDICGINQTCGIIPENVCIELINKLLNEGRTLFIDNFYVSYELAIRLLNFKTHVVGTVRHNKNFMPKDVTLHRLKRGEMISREDNNGIVVLKWRNLRDVCILSSKHAPVMVPIADSSILNSSRPKMKPLALIAYNNGKSDIDRSHQMVSYATTIRKSIKWYQKLAIHFLIGISVMNAHIVYQKATNQKIKIRKFRELIVREWLESENARPHTIEKAFHQLQVRKNPQGKSIRRMCVRCYAKQRQTQQRQEVRKHLQKTITYCPECPRSPQLCFLCFNEYHHNQ